MSKLKVMSFFSGVGGFELGLPQDKTELVGLSEIDPFCSDVLRYRFKGIKNYGDITKIKPEELPYADVYVGGSPCQDLSNCGNREGLAGSRSGLFFNFIKVLRANRPKYFIFENVKGMFSCNEGRDFATVQIELAESGYNIQWYLCNARSFGVPQNRERIFIIGYNADKCGREILHQKRTSKSFPSVISNAPQRTQGSCKEGPFIQTRFLGRNGPLTSKVCPTIMATDVPHFIESPPMKRLGDVGSTAQAFRVYDPNGSSSNLNANAGGTGAKTGLYLISEENKRIRKLTPIECERLMSWPDDHTKYGKRESGEVYSIADSQRYKMCGNGVVSKIVENIFETFID